MYHSQDGQDKFVDALLEKKAGGVFVEFGALDGVLHSNTLFFERERDWIGLLIEANPDAFARLEKSGRRGSLYVNCAVYDRTGYAEFEKIEGGLYGWSGIRETIEPAHWERIRKSANPNRSIISVPCARLADILDHWGHSKIDYMSIDVEGAEENILRAFPWDKFDIDVLGVEDNFGNVELDALIQQAGYQFLKKVGHDRMYRRVNPGRL